MANEQQVGKHVWRPWEIIAIAVGVTVLVFGLMIWYISHLRDEVEEARASLRETRRESSARVESAEQELAKAKAKVERQSAQLASLETLVKKNDPSKGVYVICRMDLTPEADPAVYIERTLPVVQQVLEKDEGCLFYSLLNDVETSWDRPDKNPRTFWMLEKWESIEALKAHLEAPHLKAYLPTVGGMRAQSSFHLLTGAKKR